MLQDNWTTQESILYMEVQMQSQENRSGLLLKLKKMQSFVLLWGIPTAHQY